MKTKLKINPISKIGAIRNYLLYKDMTQEKGITLVALIITIIVLIMLSAISIKILLDVGMLNLVGKAAENYKEEQLYEEGIMNNVADKIESTLNSLTDIKNGVVINPKLEILVDTEEYTFGKIEITVLATAPEGETITRIEPVDGNDAILKEGNTYIVNKNGEYSFKATTSGGKTDIATKRIKNILQAPEIIVSNVANTSLLINIQTVYPEDIVVKYEYYVDGIKKCEKTEEREYNASNLADNPNHTIKVIAYISDYDYKETEKNAFIELENITNLSGKVIDKNKIEYIYNAGTVNPNFGEVKLIDNIENNSIAVFKPDYIICQTSSRCATHNAKIGTTKTIDLSEYESVNAVIKCLNYKEGHFGVCIYSGNSKDSNRGYMDIQKANEYSSFENNKLCIVSCDITQSGIGYPTIHYTYDKFLVYQIFLIKK